MKNSYILHISDQNIDCGYSLEPPRRGGSYSLEPPRRGGSNEYPQFMFLSRNKKNNVYPGKPQFYYIKVGFKGSKLYRHVFVMNVEKKNTISICDLYYVACFMHYVAFRLYTFILSKSDIIIPHYGPTSEKMRGYIILAICPSATLLAMVHN